MGAVRPAGLPRSRFIAATIELGIRDDTLVSLKIEAGIMEVTERLLDADGRVVLGAHVVREIPILPSDTLKA